MAGSVTVTNTTPLRGPGRPIQKINLTWTSSAGGAVSGNAFGPVAGEILRVVFVPNTDASQPTTLYDVTLTILNGDAGDDGLDLLAGQGANLANNANTHVVPGVPLKDGTTTSTRPIAVNDKLDLVVANAGNAKRGQVILYVR